jgi:hypothetical protein
MKLGNYEKINAAILVAIPGSCAGIVRQTDARRATKDFTLRPCDEGGQDSSRLHHLSARMFKR